MNCNTAMARWIMWTKLTGKCTPSAITIAAHNAMAATSVTLILGFSGTAESPLSIRCNWNIIAPNPMTNASSTATTTACCSREKAAFRMANSLTNNENGGNPTIASMPITRNTLVQRRLRAMPLIRSNCECAEVFAHVARGKKQ